MKTEMGTNLNLTCELSNVGLKISNKIKFTLPSTEGSLTHARQKPELGTCAAPAFVRASRYFI